MMSIQPAAFHTYPCPELVCLQFEGQDAVTFLQSQLTQDVLKLEKSRAALAGYCTAKGRLLATMILVPGDEPDQVRMLVAADLTEDLVKRLRMFIMRSKVTVTLREDLQIRGLMYRGEAPNSELASLSQSVWGFSKLNQIGFVRAPSAQDDLHRFWVIEPIDQPLSLTSVVEHEDGQAWQVEDVRAGLPWIRNSTKDLFIPQSLNLDLIDGVCFTKGCYPGQEVVARAHYRTQVRRRMHAAKATDATSGLQASADIVPMDDPDSPVGRVIQVAELAQTGESFVLFEAPLDRVDPETLAAQSDKGPVHIALFPLPYSTVPAESTRA